MINKINLDLLNKISFGDFLKLKIPILCVCVFRMGVRDHNPSRPPSQVVGAGREDVPHQPKEAMDTNETTRPAEDGRPQEGRRR